MPWKLTSCFLYLKYIDIWVIEQTHAHAPMGYEDTRWDLCLHTTKEVEEVDQIGRYASDQHVGKERGVGEDTKIKRDCIQCHTHTHTHTHTYVQIYIVITFIHSSVQIINFALPAGSLKLAPAPSFALKPGSLTCWRQMSSSPKALACRL